VGSADGFLTLISAAVTPVVMISACAILITGVGTKHAGLSDRVRALTAEMRSLPPESGRRPLVRDQLRMFMRRTSLAWIAHCLLYLAALVFSTTVLAALLAISQHGWGRQTVSLFVLGTVLLVAAMIAELGELLLAQSTLRSEVEDLLARDKRRARDMRPGPDQ
jgi:hypothetical protein